MSQDMTHDDILAALQGIFRTTFHDSELVVSRDTTADDVRDWDSLSHIQLVTDVEAHFGVKFKLREIMKFKNVGDMCDCIANQSTS